MRVDEFQVDFVLEDLNEEDDRFIFKARSITKDFVCEAGLERLANDSEGKHVVWRHEHPLIPKFKSTHIYGTVLESNVQDGGITSTYEVYGHTPEHLKARRIISERMELEKPISISMRYRQYGEEDPIHFDVVEHSLTPTPACKDCVALDILNESEKMTDLDEKLKEIEELEKELTKKDKLLEELEGKFVVIEKQLEDLEKESKVKDKELESEKSDKDKITDQILEFKDKLNEQSKIIDELKEQSAMKDVEPLINNLIEVDGKDMADLYWMKATNAYKAGDKEFEEAKEFLKERAKARESEVHPVTTDLDETALKAQKVIDEELEDPDLAKKRDNRAFANMGKDFYEWRKNRGA